MYLFVTYLYDATIPYLIVNFHRKTRGNPEVIMINKRKERKKRSHHVTQWVPPFMYDGAEERAGELSPAYVA